MTSEQCSETFSDNSMTSSVIFGNVRKLVVDLEFWYWLGSEQSRTEVKSVNVDVNVDNPGLITFHNSVVDRWLTTQVIVVKSWFVFLSLSSLRTSLQTPSDFGSDGAGGNMSSRESKSTSVLKKGLISSLYILTTLSGGKNTEKLWNVCTETAH